MQPCPQKPLHSRLAGVRTTAGTAWWDAGVLGLRKNAMTADKELIREVAQELWDTTKKLRPGLPKSPRAQLVLKALMTIGDMNDQLEASMVLGLISDQEPDDEPAPEGSSSQEATGEASAAASAPSEDTDRTSTRVVRKRSAAR